MERAVETFERAYRGSPGEAYLEGERKIGARTAEAHRIGYVDPDNPLEGWERFAGRLCFPYLNMNKTPVWAKFRATPSMGEVKSKYAQQEGGRGRLFNVQALSAPGTTICLAEGEMDIVTLTALGIPAVGVPGATHWKSYMKRCLDGYDRVVLFYDDDEAGKGLVKAIKATMPDLIPLAAPGIFKDVGEAYVAGYGDAIRRIAYGIEEEEYDHGQENTPGQPGDSDGGDVRSSAGYNGLGAGADEAPPF